MKVTKKLFIAALAVVGFTFAGCKMNNDKNSMIDMDSVRDYATIDFTNESENNEVSRGWATFKSGHQYATARITFDDPVNLGNAGNIGYIFNLTHNNDNTSNFMMFAVNYNGNFRYYYSYFENVGDDYLSGKTSNFCDKNGVAIGQGGCLATETQIDPTSGIFTNITTSNMNKNGNSYSLDVELGWNESAKKYTVKLYKDSTAENATPFKTLTEFGKSTFNFKNETEAPDESMGVYAMCYAGFTLKGKVEFLSGTIVGSVDSAN